jgi:dipeptide/tripeptide permease
MHPGTIWAIIGVIIGIVGGLIGSYFSIKDTNGPKEKSFATKAVIISWIAGIVFLTLLFYLPKPFNDLIWIPYVIALPLAIRYWNKKQQKIRREEEKEKV